MSTGHSTGAEGLRLLIAMIGGGGLADVLLIGYIFTGRALGRVLYGLTALLLVLIVVSIPLRDLGEMFSPATSAELPLLLLGQLVPVLLIAAPFVKRRLRPATDSRVDRRAEQKPVQK